MSQFPVDKFAKIEIEQRNDTRMAKERLTRNRARGTRSSYFALMLTSPAIEYKDYMKLSGEIDGYEGGLEIFTIDNPIPAIETNSGDTTKGDHGKGDKFVDVEFVGTYSAGDFIQFSNHPKAYRIASVSGDTVTLTHPLITSVNDETLVYYGVDVQFQVCVNNAFSTTIDVKQSKFGIIDVELIEQL